MFKDPAFFATFFGGLSALITAIIAGYISLRKFAKENASANIKLNTDLKVIHTAVNSNMDKAMEKIDMLYKRIEDMEKTRVELKEKTEADLGTKPESNLKEAKGEIKVNLKEDRIQENLPKRTKSLVKKK